MQFAIVERHVDVCDRCAGVVASSPRDDFVDRLLVAERSRRDQQPPSPGPGVPNDTAAPGTHPDRLPADLSHHPRYEVLRLIAEGGMSWVYLARHRITHSLVALKSIKPEFATHGELVARFLREARLAGQLNHANVARVLDAEQFGETVYIVLEHVPGRSLAEMVAAQGPLTVADASRYIAQAALGLQHAADLGVVHRDVKPHNIMVVRETNTARILDFGLGRIADEQLTRSRLTRDDQILGTPDYMAPEQAKDSRTADVRSDIYGLGCTLYFVLAGRPPFQAGSVLDVLAKHETDAPSPIESLRSDVPPDVARLLDRMLAKQPAKRPQSPSEIARILLPHATPPVVRPKDAAGAGGFPAALARAALTPAVMLPLLTALVCLFLLFAR